MAKRRSNLSIGIHKEHRNKVSRYNKNRNTQSRKAFTIAEFIDYKGSEGAYTIGKYAGSSYYFNGVLGSVGVYDDALSGSEILQNYNFTKSRYGL
jgi:hypothetical protein